MIAPTGAVMPDGEILLQQINFWSAKAVKKGNIPNEKNCKKYNRYIFGEKVA